MPTRNQIDTINQIQQQINTLQAYLNSNWSKETADEIVSLRWQLNELKRQAGLSYNRFS